MYAFRVFFLIFLAECLRVQCFNLSEFFSYNGKSANKTVAPLNFPTLKSNAINPHPRTLPQEIQDKAQDPWFTIFAAADPQPIDFYFLIDSTGDMYGTWLSLKRDFGQIISVLEEQPFATRVRIGIGTFADERDGDAAFQNIQPLTKDLDAAKTALGRVRVAGGGDLYEANLVGLHRSVTDATIGWDEKHRKYIIYITGVAGHEPSCGRHGRLDRVSVVRTMLSNRASVYGFAVGDAYDDAPSPYDCGSSPRSRNGQMTSIVEFTSRHEVIRSSPETIVHDVITSFDRITSQIRIRFNCRDHVESDLPGPRFQTFQYAQRKDFNVTVKHSNELCASLSSGSEFFKCDFIVDDRAGFPFDLSRMSNASITLNCP